MLTGHPWPIEDEVCAQKSGIGALGDLGFSGCDVSLTLVWRMTGSYSSVIISTPLIAPHSHCVPWLNPEWSRRGCCHTSELAPSPPKCAHSWNGVFHPGVIFAPSKLCLGTCELAMAASTLIRGRTGVQVSSVLSRCMHSQWQSLPWWGTALEQGSPEQEPGYGLGGTEVTG